MRTQEQEVRCFVVKEFDDDKIIRREELKQIVEQMSEDDQRAFLARELLLCAEFQGLPPPFNHSVNVGGR